SRVAGFERESLTSLALSKKVVRATTMRATIHLMSARDFRAWRASLQPALSRALSGTNRKAAYAVDLEPLLGAARGFFEEKPRTFDALRGFLKKLHPQREERALAYAVRLHLPLVQVPV